MKIKIWARTKHVWSKDSREVDIEDWKECTNDDKEAIVKQYLEDMFMYEWGWEELK